MVVLSEMGGVMEVAFTGLRNNLTEVFLNSLYYNAATTNNLRYGINIKNMYITTDIVVPHYFTFTSDGITGACN